MVRESDVGLEVSRAGDGVYLFFFSSRRRHTRLQGDWSSDVCSSDLVLLNSGDGASFVPERVSVPGQRVDVAVGDLNGDGRSDLAAVVLNPAGLFVYLDRERGG